MTDQARVVYSYSTSVPDEPGQAFKVLATLVSAGINLLGCSGTQIDSQAHIEVVPADAAAFAALVERATLSFRRQKAGFLIQGNDRPGALADNLSRLADIGINVDGVHGLAAGAGRWSAIVWVADRDLEVAARALGASLP
ncbi:MAG: hypothetical protein IPI51_08925 [Betaproteobacteria bacterium]|jgi:hypothetical protein|nr:hypothetical protein [Betaproteobacteria bacterium]